MDNYETTLRVLDPAVLGVLLTYITFAGYVLYNSFRKAKTFRQAITKTLERKLQ